MNVIDVAAEAVVANDALTAFETVPAVVKANEAVVANDDVTALFAQLAVPVSDPI